MVVKKEKRNEIIEELKHLRMRLSTKNMIVKEIEIRKSFLKESQARIEKIKNEIKVNKYTEYQTSMYVEIINQLNGCIEDSKCKIECDLIKIDCIDYNTIGILSELNQLDDNLKRVVYSKFINNPKGSKKTLQEVADEVGKSKTRTKEILDKAIDALITNREFRLNIKK